ncbi:hypothetical protein TNCV_3320511 [Trichonephila clavipes]|nr:hypothetical protein TNCV_3320511 [Trichonephila clavipes]
MEWYAQQSECCPTQLLLLKRIRDPAAKKRRIAIPIGWRGWFVAGLRLRVRTQPKSVDFHDAENRQRPYRMIIRQCDLTRFRPNFEREYPGDGQGPPPSLSLPPTSGENLRLAGYLEYSHATKALYIDKHPCLLRDSNLGPTELQLAQLTTTPDEGDTLASTSLPKLSLKANERALNLYRLQQPLYIASLQWHQDSNPRLDNAGHEFVTMITKLPWSIEYVTGTLFTVSSPNLQMESGISYQIWKWEIVHPDDPDQENEAKL